MNIEKDNDPNLPINDAVFSMGLNRIELLLLKTGKVLKDIRSAQFKNRRGIFFRFFLQNRILYMKKPRNPSF
jgi:hypothetical protein